jgi:hypothetical protein
MLLTLRPTWGGVRAPWSGSAFALLASYLAPDRNNVSQLYQLLDAPSGTVRVVVAGTPSGLQIFHMRCF